MIRRRLAVRSHGTLARIWPKRGEAPALGDARPCVYVTGFLSDTRSEANYDRWIGCQQQLAASPLQWCEEAYSFSWATGSDGDHFGRFPLPFQTLILLARRSSPTAVIAGVAADALANSARLYLKFREAEKAAVASAPALASACSSFGGKGYRIVAHSLGCRLVLEAL